MTKNNITKSQKIGKILEINVNSASVDSVLTGVEEFVSHSQRFYIVTPNPELILMAQTDKKLRKALNGANLSIPDGIGLKVAAPSLKIIKGRELFMDLIKLANKNRWKVFLLGGLGEEAGLAAKKLAINNPQLTIKFHSGPRLDGNAEPISSVDKKLESEAIGQINTFAPQLLFVAFGNPRQEIWVNKHLSDLNIGGAMCVGGTLRYVADMSRLPPKWMADIGLEWLWRLITEPERAGRVFRAVVIFPLRVFWGRVVGR